MQKRVVLVSAASGCFGRCGEARASGRKRVVVDRMSAISWALTAAAAGMFLCGAWRNAGARRGPTRGRYHSRYGRAVLECGLFSSAAVSSIIAFLFGITAYVYQETEDPEPQPQPQAADPGPGVAMVQPHFQPQQAYAYPAMGYPAAAAAAPPYGGYGAKASAGTA